MEEKISNDPKIELSSATAGNHNRFMNSIFLMNYKHFIRKAVIEIRVRAGDLILDLCCETGKNAIPVAEYPGHEGRTSGTCLLPVMEKEL